MQNPWLELRNEIAKSLKVHIREINDNVKPSAKFGDFAYFNSKEMRREEIDKIKKPKFIKEIRGFPKEGEGDRVIYVNFYVDWPKFTNEKLFKVIRPEYGSGDVKGTILLDVFSANPFKSFHIGHVRNAVLGESVRRILKFTGRETKTYCYSGDVGTHVATWLWYFNKFYKGKIPKKNFTRWVGEIYAKAVSKREEKSEYEDEVKKINILLDKRDKTILPVWKKIRKLCYDDYKAIAKELESKIDEYYPESDCEKPGKEMVSDLLETKKDKLKKSDGAIIIDLERHGLGVLVLLKSDGTALYSTKDFGLYNLKTKDYKPDKILYIVGSEQVHYLRQLFKAFELLGISKRGKNTHVSHGLVTLKEGKMASRLGNVILYEDLRDETIKKVKEKLKDSSIPEQTIKDVAFGAIKFSMLNIENNKPISFDWEEVLDFEGKSGPYLQYSHARACSILRKEKPKDYDASNLKKEIEIELLRKLAKFPDIVKKAADGYSPHIISNYLFGLAQDFNSFYQTIPVLKAKKEKNARLKLVDSVKTVLKRGLYLLGIEAPEKM